MQPDRPFNDYLRCRTWIRTRKMLLPEGFLEMVRAVVAPARTFLRSFAVIAMIGASAGVPAAAQRIRNPESLPVAKPEAPRSLPLPDMRPRSIDILGAVIGHSGSKVSCSALVAVKHACDSRISCSITVTDDICEKPDSQIYLMPMLEVRYRCIVGAPPRVKRTAKPFTMYLSCNDK